MTENDKKLWLLIQNQLPDFMRHDESYSQFLTFLEAYYRYLQEEGSNNPVELISNTEYNRDIDKTLDDFVDHFERMFLDGFPVVYDTTESVPSLKRKKRDQIKRVVKNSNDLFVSKSVEDAYRNLFRILYDEEIELFYPKTVILKPSDGKWHEDVTVKVRVTSGDLNAFDLTYGSAYVEEYAGTVKTGANATVESIVATSTEDFITYELFLNKASITKPNRAYSTSYADANPSAEARLSFEAGNTVKVLFGSLEVEGLILEVLTQITITSEEPGYTTASPLTVWDNGVEHPVAQVEIKSVFEDGRIKRINVVESGYSFTGPVVIKDADGNQVATVRISGLTYYPGEFQEVDGFLSDQTRLRGPKPSKIYPSGHIPEEYYQEFSYVIKSSVSMNTWKQIIKNVLHPSGYSVFGEISLYPNEGDGGKSILGMLHFNQDSINAPEINGNGGYLYYLLKLLFVQFVQLPVQTIAELTVSPVLISSPGNVFGPSFWSIDTFKSLSPAYEGGTTPFGGVVPDSDVDMALATKVVAWDADFEGNTQLQAIGHLVLGDFYDGVAKSKKTNICPDSYIIYRAYP